MTWRGWGPSLGEDRPNDLSWKQVFAIFGVACLSSLILGDAVWCEFDSQMCRSEFCVPTWPFIFTWAAFLVKVQLDGISWITLVLTVSVQRSSMAERVSCPIRSFQGRSLLPLLVLWLQMNPFTFSTSQFSHGEKWRWHCPSHRSEDNSLSAQVTEELIHKFSNLPQPSTEEYFSYVF